jgi:hypothetical protein
VAAGRALAAWGQPWLPGLVALGGWAGSAVYLAAALPLPVLPRAAQLVLFALASGSFLLGAFSTAASPTEPAEGSRLFRRMQSEIGSGVRRAYPAAAPLALLPFTRHLPAPGSVALAVALVAVVLLQAQRPPGLAAPTRQRLAWRAALLVGVLCVSVLYVALGARAHGNWDNDGAYYFGVAKHIATTHRFEEPLVWHFLRPPGAIVHRPFDYWGGLTSLLLVPPLMVFGATYHVAAISMAVLSSASLVLFWRLLCFEIRLREPLLEALALVVFAFTPWLPVARLDTESIVPFQVLLLSALVLYARDRLGWCVIVSFALVLDRTEGILLCTLLWVACAQRAASLPSYAGHRARVRLVLMGATCVGAFCAYHFVVFGVPFPPGVRAVGSLARYSDLYAYGERRGAPGLLARLWAEPFGATVERTVTAVRAVKLVARQDFWMMLALVPGAGFFRRRPRIESVVWVLFFGGALALVMISPPATFSVGAQRSLANLAPLAAICGAVGMDEILVRAGRVFRRHAVASAIVVGAALVMVSPLDVYQPDARPAADEDFATLSPVLSGEPVASDNPWQIVAMTGSPAVSIPENGEGAMEEVFRRYDVRWVVLGPNHAWMHESKPVLDELLAGRRARIGRFSLVRQVTRSKWPVFRVKDVGG